MRLLLVPVLAALAVAARAAAGDLPLDPGRLEAPGLPDDRRAPVIRLTIPADELSRIASRRERAVFENHLFDDGRFWSDARLEFEGTARRVRLRLKGNRPLHWRDPERWSYRVQIRDKNPVMGMTVFSLHQSFIRDNHWEWLACAVGRRAGLLAGRYDLVRLEVNGRDHGVFAIEDFDRHMLEVLERREGPVLKFNEDRYWNASRLAIRRSWRMSPDKADEYYLAGLEAMNESAVAKDPAQARLFEHAKKRLDLYRRERVPAGQVFDVERTGEFLALLDLLGTDHPIHPHNVRLYYNPMTARFEPLGQDFWAVKLLKTSSSGLRRPKPGEAVNVGLRVYMGSLNRDPLIRASYRRALRRFSDPGFLEDLRRDLGPDLLRRTRLVQSQAGLEGNVLWSTLARNQAVLRRALVSADVPPDHPPAFSAVLAGVTGSRVRILLANRLPTGVAIEGAAAGSLDEGLVELRGGLRLPPAEPGRGLRYVEAVFTLPPGTAWDPRWNLRTHVHARIPGERGTLFEDAFPAQDWDQAFLDQDLLLRAAAADPAHPPLPPGWRRQADGAWVLPEGSSRLEATLVVPAGIRLKAGPGTRLTLASGASLISMSPLEWSGSPAEPVHISAEKGGGGVAVLDAGELSRLEHVDFEGLTPPVLPGVLFTGVLSFHRSPLRAAHCRFLGARGEDALNVVSTDMSLTDCAFEDAFSDAFDGDFVTGQIRRTRFLRSGNDAIDISGGHLDLEQVDIDGFGDKGLSAGENGRLAGRGISIRAGEIGAASKDGASLDLQGLRMDGVKLGFAVFQKKRHFGPGRAAASKARLDGVATPHLVETGSRLLLNGVAQSSDQQAVRQRLYGEDFGKASER